MTSHSHAIPASALLPLALMWFGMMTAMMAPTAWPWLRAFHQLTGAPSTARRGSTVSFGVGYVVAWLGYAIVAALLQWALQGTQWMPSSDAVNPDLGAIIFLAAGAYQFARVKRACLTHCRTPLGYFLTYWRDGPIGAFRMGLHHGAFCVGCCWLLMATAFAVGTMNAWWMAALGVLVLAEQTTPYGHALRIALGGALLVAGAVGLTM